MIDEMAEEVVDRSFAVRFAAVNRRADDLGSSLSVAPEYGEKGRATKH